MLIELFETTTVDALGRTWKRKAGRFQCDQCGVNYESGNNLKRDLQRPRNYCSKTCSNEAKKSGGLSHQAFRATNLARYGVNAPAQNVAIRSKMKQTNIERYGAPCALGCSTIQDRAIKTRVARYGVKYSSQIPGVMNKAANTNLERYGTVNPMNAPSITATYDQDAMHVKRLNTMKRNGTIGRRTSMPEQAFHQSLIDKFGSEHVDVQIKVPGRRWAIDFYVRPINTWIQVDGVYWHGLDRPIKEIAKHKTKQDVQIHKKWLDDRVQDAWFAEREMRLIRVTDKDVYRATKSSGGSNALIELGIIAASGSVSSHVEPQRSHVALQPASW